MVRSERSHGVEIISFTTDTINALNVEAIRSAIVKLFETPYTRVVIDMTGITNLDSTAFAMFLHLLRVARSNYCNFRLCSLTPRAMELFELLQLHHTLDIFSDRESAEQSFRHAGPTGG